MDYPLQAIADAIFLQAGEFGEGGFGPTMDGAEQLTQKLLEGPLKDPRVIIALADRARK